MKKFFKTQLERTELTSLMLLLALVVVFQFKSESTFLNADNIRGILGILPETGLVAIGVTVLMIAGEFDLSVGSVFALMPMVMAVLMQHEVSFALAMACGIMVSAAIGFLNGYLTIKFSIPSFISTLGMLFIARSLTVVISGGFPPLLPDILPTWLFTDFIGPGHMFRMSFIWFCLAGLLASLMFSHTNFGNWITATGGFHPAAKAMGIATTKVKIACFMLCSMLAGFAGMLQVLRLGSPLPSIGEGLELQAVASAVIGGVSLAGGVGTVLGGIIGAILIRVIDNGMVLSGIDANWFKFAVGFLTIFAVVANSTVRRHARAMKVGE